MIDTLEHECPADQEPALPLQRVHLRMLTKHSSQLARPAPASAPDKERSAHSHHLTSKPGWRQPDFRATAAVLLAGAALLRHRDITA